MRILRFRRAAGRVLHTCQTLGLLSALALAGCAGGAGRSAAIRVPSPTERAFERMAMATSGEKSQLSSGEPVFGDPAAFSVVTLGAGDALGRMIFINDIMLAARERLGDPVEHANVPDADQD